MAGWSRISSMKHWSIVTALLLSSITKKQKQGGVAWYCEVVFVASGMVILEGTILRACTMVLS